MAVLLIPVVPGPIGYAGILEMVMWDDLTRLRRKPREIFEESPAGSARTAPAGLRRRVGVRRERDDSAYDEAFRRTWELREMCAWLAVALAAHAENFMVDIGRYYCIDHRSDGWAGCGRPEATDMVKLTRNLGQWVGADLRALPGYESYRRARALANCYKHNSGRVNEEYNQAFRGSGVIGAEIRFEEYGWDEMTVGTRTFLSELAWRAD
jgi:hypothetical protein